MFEAKNISIVIANQYYVKDLSFTLNQGDKLAIIGEEGNGKSTLLKCILGCCDYATMTGTINTFGHQIGYLEQEISNQEIRVFDYLFFHEEDYYHKVNLFYKYLKQFDMKDTILEQRISSLSGGEKVKVNLLKLLLHDCDIFFFDEPTNDLDMDTLIWLEKFIQNTEKPILYISHDETLLRNTATMILHLEQQKKKTECVFTLEKTDYHTYVMNRSQRIKHQMQMAKSEHRKRQEQEAILNQMKQKVDYQLNTISRSNPHGAQMLKRKMHSLKAQEKRLDQTEITEKPDIEESIHFFFEPVIVPKTKRILEKKIPTLQQGDNILAKNIELNIYGPERVCFIGKNGIGKTTLLKEILKDLKKRTDLKVGYMPQNYEEVLNLEERTIDFLTHKNFSLEAKYRMYLGNLNFTREEMVTKIKHLSNGTRAKLLFIKFVIDQCDVLVLDEPTRNVSPLSNPVIRSVLKHFGGTIVSVSHDRIYIEEIMDTVYELTASGLVERKDLL